MAWTTAGGAAVALPATLLPAPAWLSFSQVSSLAPEVSGSKYGCAKKWAYGKLLGLPMVGGPMLHVGSCVDKGVSAFLACRVSGVSVDGAAVVASMALTDGLKETPLDQPYRDVATKLMARVLSHLADTVPAAVQMPVDFLADVGEGRQRKVIGYLDWLTVAGVITDLKVVGSEPARNVDSEEWLADKRIQLTLYYLALRDMQARGVALPASVDSVGELVVAYLKVGMATPQLRTRRLAIEAEDIERTMACIRLADERSRSLLLPINPGMACVLCDHQQRCRDDSIAHPQHFSAMTGVPEDPSVTRNPNIPTRPTPKEVVNALAVSAPVVTNGAAVAAHTVVDGETTWAALEAEVPALLTWVSGHGPEVQALEQRIRIGNERRMTAVAEGNLVDVAAIDARLEEIRAQAKALDYGARRLLAIRAALTVKSFVGPCRLTIAADDGAVALTVKS